MAFIFCLGRFTVLHLNLENLGKGDIVISRIHRNRGVVKTSVKCAHASEVVWKHTMVVGSERFAPKVSTISIP